jgi:hypothetical protein
LIEDDEPGHRRGPQARGGVAGGSADDAGPRTNVRKAALAIGADFLLALRGESKGIPALLDARAEWPEKRPESRDATLRHIARTLTFRLPRLAPEFDRRVAVVLLHNMKTMKVLMADHAEGAAAELREMERLDLLIKIREQG